MSKEEKLKTKGGKWAFVDIDDGKVKLREFLETKDDKLAENLLRKVWNLRFGGSTGEVGPVHNGIVRKK